MSNSKFIAAAAAALAAAPGANALAADVAASAHNDLNVSVEGGLVVSDFSKSSDFMETTQKLGNVDDAPYDLGGYGAISIGKNFQDSAYDWKLSGSITEFMTNERDGYGNYGYYTGTEVDDFDFQAVDLDLGKTFTNETASGRVFAGVRVLNAQDNASNEFGYYYNAFTTEFNVDGNFLGAGPRVGMDLRVGGTVGLVGSVSAAAVFGRQSAAGELSYGAYGLDGYIEFSDTDVDWDWVTDVSATAGVSVRPSEDAELVLGYRAEQISDIRAASSEFGRDEDVLQHGPVLKLNVKF